MADKFIIKDTQLAEALEITNEKLAEIQDFFDENPDDEWEIVEGKDYIKQATMRIYSYEGAYAIAEYLHSHEKLNLLEILKEWFTKFKTKLRQSLVKQRIIDTIDSPGKLIKVNNYHFISKKDVVTILGTSYARLNIAFEEIKKTQKPLTPGEDFIDNEGIRYYSLQGFYKISRHLGENLKMKNRQDWCEDTSKVGKKTVNQILKSWDNWQQQINQAKNFVKNTRDKKTCKVSGKKAPGTNLTGIVSVAAHHLYSSYHYPHIAASTDNLITITTDIHDEFHAWMGGSQKKCTIDEFIIFVNERYPESDEVKVWLKKQKMILGNPQPSVIKTKELLLPPIL